MEPLTHRTLSGAPCRPLARPRIALGLRGRPLAQSTVGSPDRPVNFSRTPLNDSRERRLHRRRLTGQSGAPPDSPVNYSRTPPSVLESGLFTGGWPGAPDTIRCTTGHCPVCQTVLSLGCSSQDLFFFSFL
jgi:hypothetical protein